MIIDKLLAVAEVGGTVVLWLLVLLSVWSIGVIAERWWYFRKRRTDARELAEGVLSKLRRDDREGAIKLLRASPSVEGEIAADALEWYDHGPESVREILEKGIRDRRPAYENGLVLLGTLGNNAPFIGLFGTVLGIVTAFHELGHATSGAGGGAAGMTNVMTGISAALVATAVGILVAIPAVVAYNNFSKKAEDIEEHVGAIGNAIVAHMKGEPAGDSVRHMLARPRPTLGMASPTEMPREAEA